jgi:outer membrane protein
MLPTNMKTLLPAVLAAVAAANPLPAALGADLMAIYALASDSDPEFRRMAAVKRAVLEQRPQALATLLPSVNLRANAYENEQDITADFIPAGSGDLEFASRGYSLDMSQPLFRADRFLRLRQADSRIRQADAELAAAQQDLMMRVSDAYFNVLAASDNLAFARAERHSLSRQLEQASQRFEVGLIAITDVQEAQAGHDRAVAEELAAENNVDNAREALRQITGQYIEALAPLGDDMPLVSPEPQDIDAWTDTALDQNLQIIASLHGVETARQEIRAQSAGHLPTLDLVARHGYDRSGGRFGATELYATAVGLELNVPIFEGGAVSSRSREARQRLDERLEVLEAARRQAQRQTREAYLGVISGISRVQALQQAVVSAETALRAVEAGFEVGTRTAIDVVTAERNTSQARRDFARARYDYALNTLRLKLAAGTLSDQDLAHINRWLR